MLYRAIELPSQEPVQFVGVYVLNWGKEDQPTVGFVMADEDEAKKTDKICKLVNDKFSWIMHVDEEEITFNGHHNADYFAQHYSDLGYTIEWDKNKWRGDE